MITWKNVERLESKSAERIPTAADLDRIAKAEARRAKRSLKRQVDAVRMKAGRVRVLAELEEAERERRDRADRVAAARCPICVDDGCEACRDSAWR